MVYVLFGGLVLLRFFFVYAHPEWRWGRESDGEREYGASSIIEFHPDKRSPPQFGGLTVDIARRLGRAGSLEEMLTLLSQEKSLSLSSSAVIGIREVSVSPLRSPFGSTFGRSGMGGGGVTFARSAPCQPEDKTVKLPLPNDPGVIFVPECTRIPQCGGCCQHDLLSCLPTRTEPLHFHVLALPLNGSAPEKILVEVESHVSCGCDCRMTAADCGKNQIFRDCVCECVNLQEQRDCQRLSYKIWDHKDCSCKCLHEVPCSTGQYFDPIICRCKSYPDTTHYWQKGNVGWGYTGEGTTTTTTTSRSNLNWSDSGPRYGTDGRAYMGPSTYPRRDERRNSDRGNPAGGSHESTSPPHHMERRDETNEKGRIQKNIFDFKKNLKEG